MPRGTAPTAPLLGEDGPPFVVAPAPTDLEILRRVAFAGEAKSSDERDGGHIAGLNVGLEPVEAECPEPIGEGKPQGLGHVAVPRPGRVDVVAEIGALEGPAHDLTDLDRAKDRIVFRATNEEGREIRSPAAG